MTSKFAEQFDRRELILEFIEHENVSIIRHDEPLAIERGSTLWTECDMRFRIGALCIVEIEFVKLGSQPEAATVSIQHAGYRRVYEAGAHSAKQIASETVAAARSYRFLVVEAGEPYRIEPNRMVKKPKLRRSLNKAGKAHLDCDAPFSDMLDEQDRDEVASRVLGGAVRRVGYRLKKRNGVPSGRLKDQEQRLIAYEDFSWETGFFRGKDRDAMPIVAEVLQTWPELFPDFEVTGCGECAVYFEYAGHRGEFYICHDYATVWREGKRSKVGHFGVDLVYFLNDESQWWHGSARADLPHDGIYEEDEIGQIVDDLHGRAVAFRATVDSFVNDPIVCDETDFDSSYRDARGTNRSYYPTSTAREIEQALRACGSLRPIELARAIVGDGSLPDYTQRTYDSQHDVERVMKILGYSPETGEIRLESTTTECANLQSLPTAWTTKRVRAVGFTLERLLAVASLEPEPEPEPDPYFLEWSIHDRLLGNGEVEYRVYEFPDLISRDEDAFDAYHRLYDLISERIAELQAAGEPIPSPFALLEREELHQDDNQ